MNARRRMAGRWITGLRVHMIVRETEIEAYEYAEELVSKAG
jgi:alkanesulfonate monooxygenase SsuD/methylene tetrahydromethanopterin reductase-like flavin-dependent oxidoreductase (luciferase family)